MKGVEGARNARGSRPRAGNGQFDPWRAEDGVQAFNAGCERSGGGGGQNVSATPQPVSRVRPPPA
jgi:hypothetical protein